MRNRAGAMLIMLGAILWQASAFAAAYDTQTGKAVAWLLQQQNKVDGSWGASDDLRYVQTAQAVLALAAINQRSPEYYAGITWLENHAPANLDYRARRILALQANGDDTSADLHALQSAQQLAAPGNNGFGLSKTYSGAALDTALILQALSQAGISTNVASAVAYLKGAQLTGTDKGWVIGQESVSDPITTAQVIQALVPLQAGDAALAAVIANSLATLNNQVGITSPAPQLAAAAMANLRAGNTAVATTLFNALAAAQGTDGSWGGDPYATALSLHGLAAGMSRDIAAQKQTVLILDAALRSSINQALGRGNLDALSIGELQQLTSLDISSRGIKDLTGLQYATNLRSLDARNNQIASFAPIANLTITTLLEAGNPGYVTPVAQGDGDVPTLPEWGMILLGSLLLLAMVRQRRTTQS